MPNCVTNFSFYLQRKTRGFISIGYWWNVIKKSCFLDSKMRPSVVIFWARFSAFLESLLHHALPINIYKVYMFFWTYDLYFWHPHHLTYCCLEFYDIYPALCIAGIGGSFFTRCRFISGFLKSSFNYLPLSICQ